MTDSAKRPWHTALSNISSNSNSTRRTKVTDMGVAKLQVTDRGVANNANGAASGEGPPPVRGLSRSTRETVRTRGRAAVNCLGRGGKRSN